MSDHNRPIIIKRRVVVAAAGHHGGAWKVAYADFVTAMMAFFLLMWLLSATTERQRKGLSDYFSPSVSMSAISSGGDGLLYGEETSTNAATSSSEVAGNITVNDPQTFQDKEALDRELAKMAAEKPELASIMTHITTRISDEGFVIELYDREEASVFADGGAQLGAGALQLIASLVHVLEDAEKNIAINGHMRSIPVAFSQEPSWEISTARAQSVHQALLSVGFNPQKVKRVSGHADRSPAVMDPNSIRNNRIEVILLR